VTTQRRPHRQVIDPFNYAISAVVRWAIPAEPTPLRKQWRWLLGRHRIWVIVVRHGQWTVDAIPRPARGNKAALALGSWSSLTAAKELVAIAANDDDGT
jgi:hypothetical protein